MIDTCHGASIIKFRPEHAVAWIYLCAQADNGLAGQALNDFCNSFDDEMHRRTWPGPDIFQMTDALRWARRWTRPERHGLRRFRETGTPLPPVGPEGLYGRPQGPQSKENTL